jgi:NitT/TauT family transport system substrate-binding protein
MPVRHTRRQVVTVLSLAGAFGSGGAADALAADPPPEASRMRLLRAPGTCLAPEYVAEELLRAEGVTDIRYVEVASDADSVKAIVSGEVDFGPNYASQFTAAIDAGEPVTILGGLHVGCFELRARNEIRRISDLKGTEGTDWHFLDEVKQEAKT